MLGCFLGRVEHRRKPEAHGEHGSHHVVDVAITNVEDGKDQRGSDQEHERDQKEQRKREDS